MPRQPRLDAPGILHHVMARGIERRAIFIDDSDPRILGTGDFVAEVIRNKSELDEKRRLQSVPLPNLLTNIAKHLGISEAEILSNSRKRDIGRARALISYAGVRVLKYPVFEVAKLLKNSSPSVSKCIQRGEMMIGGDTEAIEKAIN